MDDEGDWRMLPPWFKWGGGRGGRGGGGGAGDFNAKALKGRLEHGGRERGRKARKGAAWTGVILGDGRI